MFLESEEQLRNLHLMNGRRPYRHESTGRFPNPFYFKYSFLYTITILTGVGKSDDRTSSRIEKELE